MNILEREYVDLRSQRVRIYKAIEHMQMRIALEPHRLYGQDGNLNALADLQAQYRGTQRRWAELHALTGRRLAGPPIKLDTPTRSAPVRRASTRSVPSGYLTRALFPER